MMFKVFVQPCGCKTKNITVNAGLNMTVLQLKKKIQEIIPGDIEPIHQRLIYGTQQLQPDTKILDSFNIMPNCNIILVHRLPGAGGYFSKAVPQCVICYQESSALVRMPCGHYHCYDCIQKTCENQAGDHKTQIECSICEAEWSSATIKRYSGIADKELIKIYEKFSLNIIKKSETNTCPGCDAFCDRIDKSKLRVYCFRCQSERKYPYYCFHCLHTWKSGPNDKNCGNEDCDAVNEWKLEYIKKAPLKKIAGVNCKCPSIRFCPNCGMTIEHTEACKHIACSQCKVSFCFVCLRKQICGEWQCGSWRDHCKPAPVQETVPSQSFD